MFEDSTLKDSYNFYGYTVYFLVKHKHLNYLKF